MTAPRNIGEQIHQLRSQGMSYSQICKELNCSKGSVSYHLGDGVKDKQKTYKENNITQARISKKIFCFCNRSKSDAEIIYQTRIIQRIKTKIQDFTGRKNVSDFTYQELMDKIGDDPKCYLTGDKINLNKTRSWHLDHKVPIAKGGKNTLDNCEIATRDANQAKHDMSHEDFLEFCQKVLVNNGYSVLPVGIEPT